VGEIGSRGKWPFVAQSGRCSDITRETVTLPWRSCLVTRDMRHNFWTLGHIMLDHALMTAVRSSSLCGLARISMRVIRILNFIHYWNLVACYITCNSFQHSPYLSVLLGHRADDWRRLYLPLYFSTHSLIMVMCNLPTRETTDNHSQPQLSVLSLP